MQILKFHPSPSESEILGWGPGVCVFILTGTAGYSNAGSSPGTLKRRGQRPCALNRSPEMGFHSPNRYLGGTVSTLPFPEIPTILSLKDTQSWKDLVSL